MCRKSHHHIPRFFFLFFRVLIQFSGKVEPHKKPIKKTRQCSPVMRGWEKGNLCLCVPHHRAIEIRINGPRVDRRFSTTAGGESDPGGISELLRLLDVSVDGWSRPTGADNSLLLRRRTDNEPDSDLYQTEINSVKGYLLRLKRAKEEKETDIGQGPCC